MRTAHTAALAVCATEVSKSYSIMENVETVFPKPRSCVTCSSNSYKADSGIAREVGLHRACVTMDIHVSPNQSNWKSGLLVELTSQGAGGRVTTHSHSKRG
ncbi:hypothetical protein BKA82DRAFT_998733 [Pisolithus tinctorius]|uniref:Uncharacterized protein n=1 Tax=Pisolithus tinctorius Marx 270 TaxID=870435 RepID=A0A0C3PFB2_PISTI|nr:hypothetical protein BKA82DRAFT_998733 [Pisolithus tinctorius]KIO06604.1 hypothetical protein M404DRAFT_998733 [Pisolithus tinctorius Marx 270]